MCLKDPLASPCLTMTKNIILFIVVAALLIAGSWLLQTYWVTQPQADQTAQTKDTGRKETSQAKKEDKKDEPKTPPGLSEEDWKRIVHNTATAAMSALAVQPQQPV